MKIVAIIPARGGSKGIPRKNIKSLAQKPLIAYSIEAAQKSKYIDRTILSTEDNEIEKVAKQFGAEVFKRPEELAQDITKTAPVLLNVVEELEKQNYHPDIVILLQPTSPLRTTKQIDAVVEKLLNSDNDSVFTGFWFSQAMPLWQKDDDGNFKSLYNYHLRPRRQEESLRGNIFCEDGSIYAIKIDAFKKHKDFIGENPYIFETKQQIDIDTVQDFENVEKIILNRN